MKIIEVVGDSMVPSLEPGQLVIFRTINFEKINRYKIITFKFKSKLLIKRVVGFPGESVKITGNDVYINGEFDSHIWNNHTDLIEYKWDLAANQFVVLGDNPKNSLDSRKIGPINMENLFHIAWFRIWPPKLL